MSWDPKAERITAKGQAAKDAAEAAAILARAAREDRAADRQEAAERRAERAQRRQQRKEERAKQRAAVLDAIRRYAVPVGAIGSPEVIAWSGQYSFAEKTMKLGWLAPLLPVALEGGTLYTAKLALDAIADGKPAGKYRFATWVQAGIAAGMNYWHGSAKGAQVGVAFALTSLLGIVMLELTVALRRHKASGRSGEQIRQSLIRRIRYPRLSAQAAAIAAARGVEAEDAWRAAWIDRYGIGPEATRRERRTSRTVLARQQRTDRKAARSGDLVIQDGVLLRPAQPEFEETARVVGDWKDPRPHSDEVEYPDLSAYVAGGIAEFEELLEDQASAHGDTLELPGAPSDERSSGEVLSAQQDASVSGDERSDTTGRERSKSGRADTASGEGERSKPRRRTRKASAQLGRADRLPAVRRLLTDRPEMSGADIAAELGIPESTARRLRSRVLRERGEQ